MQLIVYFILIIGIYAYIFSTNTRNNDKNIEDITKKILDYEKKFNNKGTLNFSFPQRPKMTKLHGIIIVIAILLIFLTISFLSLKDFKNEIFKFLLTCIGILFFPVSIVGIFTFSERNYISDIKKFTVNKNFFEITQYEHPTFSCCINNTSFKYAIKKGKHIRTFYIHIETFDGVKLGTCCFNFLRNDQNKWIAFVTFLNLLSNVQFSDYKDLIKQSRKKFLDRRNK